MRDYFRSRQRLPADPLAKRIEGAHHRFFGDFVESSGVNHSGSKGTSRETGVKGFFSSLLPDKFAASSGEIIDTKGHVSPQSDLIIYRKSDGIPILKEEPTILQVESVMSVTEVKSKITLEEYKDCLRKAKRLFELKPFGKKLEGYSRGRQPAAEECRIFISIFAYGSDMVSGLAEEYARFQKAAVDVGVDKSLIDRVYILGKGIINPADRTMAQDTPTRKIGLFYFYSNLLQFIVREARRRKETPYLLYFGRMSEGWEEIPSP